MGNFFSFFLLFLHEETPSEQLLENATRQGSFQLLETVPHDSTAFTQGLVFGGDELYESTAHHGQSDVRHVQLATGAVLQQTDLNDTFFGEGLAFSNFQLIQLTWKAGRGFCYDATDLRHTGTFEYSHQGWGIAGTPAHDTFFVTDGSNQLYAWQKTDDCEFTEVNRTDVYQVTSQIEPVRRLNELEYDASSGTLLANVWQTDDIVRIDPATGYITDRYDLSELYDHRHDSADVLNGIACVPETDCDELWVTGKLWPSMFRIRLTNE